MINAKFTAAGGSIMLQLQGHAGAAPKGKDLICAAASMLAYTLAQTMEFMQEEGGLQVKPTIRLEEGDVLILAKPKPDRYAEALHAFFVTQAGYHLLEHNYPQNVKLCSFGAAAKN